MGTRKSVVGGRMMLTIAAFVLGLAIGRAWRRQRSLEELAEEAAAVAYELETDASSPLNRRRRGERAP